MNQKGNTTYLIIVIVIGVLAIVSLAWLYIDTTKQPAQQPIIQQTTPKDKSIDQKNYKNEQYGFNFDLPNSWQGYSILTDKWDGYKSGETGDIVVETGPQIFIRHPLWAPLNPRQDIPIMVFTIKQWNELEQGKFSLGAAPINPSELGRNVKYVFALPARYNYAYSIGWEEVEQILSNNPFYAY